MAQRTFKPHTLAAALVAATSALTGCANMPGMSAANATAPTAASAPVAAASSAGAAKTSASAPAAAASRAAPDPTAPKPFADIIKDAKETKGFFSLWKKDEKTWLEIGEKQFNKPFAFAVNISNSVGERGLYASQMGPNWMAEFRKVGNTVQLVALNQNFRSPNDKAMAVATSQSFSNSLLASTPVGSAAHPERKSVLIDAAFLLTDIPNTGFQAEYAFRMPYAFDKGNSHLTSSRTERDITTVSTNMHFSVPRIPLPPSGPTPAPSGAPLPTPPTSTPEARSFFIGYVYSLMPLPEKPMAVRLADPRVGHFTTAYTDLSSDIKFTNRVHMINRWRLEKKDPNAAMSEPVKPITFWLDKNIPVRYRKAVTDGILDWNKAFEAIGFKGAVVAKQQPDNATWDNMDGKHASVRWFTGADVGFAIGPSRKDPRTGEILDADIGMSDVFARGTRRAVSNDLSPQNTQARLSQVMAGVKFHANHQHDDGACNYADEAAVESDFAMALLEERGEIAPDSPEADALVNARIRHTMAHEVGHTLGFKHNFKASTSFTAADLQKPGPLSNSVMEYLPHNVPLKGEGKGSLINAELGPYDYWAVAYAYSQFPKDKEAAELAKIAARSTEPQLAFGDDSDAGYVSVGIDPNANRFDLGNDPLAYFEKRLKLSQELFGRMADRKIALGEDPLRVRRSLNSGFQQAGSAIDLVGKYIGGMHMVRDLPGTTQRRVYTPVDPAKQRQALRFLTDGVFDSKAFKFPPSLLTSLGVDYNEWVRDTPFSVTARVGQIQGAAMSQIFDPRTANALLELPNFVDESQRKGIISLSEVYATTQKAVWAELSTGADTDRIRRNLQRNHLTRVTTALTKGGLPNDAQSLMRAQAVALQAQLQRAAAKPGKTSAEHQAHVKDALAQLTQALQATMTRS